MEKLEKKLVKLVKIVKKKNRTFISTEPRTLKGYGLKKGHKTLSVQVRKNL